MADRQRRYPLYRSEYFLRNRDNLLEKDLPVFKLKNWFHSKCLREFLHKLINNENFTFFLLKLIHGGFSANELKHLNSSALALFFNLGYTQAPPAQKNQRGHLLMCLAVKD